MESFDPEAPTVTVQAGVDLDSLLRWLLPRGLFLPVTPGTKFVTIGGAIAADVHGKNHHKDGSFCEFVTGLRVATPTGIRDLTQEDELFWATAGGMGLTGVVLSATLRLRRVLTSAVRVDTERSRDLDDLMSRMTSGDDDYLYSVAWVDTLARGGSLGRAVLTRGDHAEVEVLPVAWRSEPLRYSPPRPVAAPPLPSGLLNRWSLRAFNEAWYAKAPQWERDRPRSIEAFFYPLDAAADWNRLYGRRGFVQYQFLVPDGEEATLRRIIEMMASRRVPTFLTVLKRFRSGNRGHLSFPRRGWTLATDIPASYQDLPSQLDRLDEVVAEAGGRIYLAKDSRMSARWIPTMYPELGRWREVVHQADPDGVLRSDLDRRLGLTGR